jgi:hypothetical protein
MLRKFDPLCKDSDPRVAEGDTMSNMMLWLDMGMISAKLMNAAIRCGAWDMVPSLAGQATAYMAAAYEAGRNWVDMVTLELLNRPAADLHARNVRKGMESTILSGKAAEFIQTSNKQTQADQSRSIASSLASGPSTAGQKRVDALSDDPPKFSRTAKRRVNKEAAAEKAKAAAEKSIAEATRVAGAAKKKNDGPSRAPHKGVNLDAERATPRARPRGNYPRQCPGRSLFGGGP